MKYIALTCALLLHVAASAQYYLSKNAEVSFFSSAATEDIDAKNTLASSVLNATNGEVIIKITNTAFKFKSALMEEHFNENYMESPKYPVSEFRGRIVEAVDYTKEGKQEVTVTGKLTMHGVTKEVTEKVLLETGTKNVRAKCKFRIRLADYQIKVPSLYIGKIAEDVEVTIDALYEPYKK